MLSVLNYFWQLSTLRSDPSRVPATPALVAVLLTANLLVGFIVNAALTNTMTNLQLATMVVAQQATLAGLLWVGLTLRELPQRFLATFAAWLGCDLLITAITWVALTALYAISAQLPQAIGQLFLLWTLAALANIVRHAFNVNMPMGVIISFGLIVFAMLVSFTAVTV